MILRVFFKAAIKGLVAVNTRAFVSPAVLSTSLEPLMAPESLLLTTGHVDTSAQLSQAEADSREAGQLPEVLQPAIVELGFGLAPSDSFCSSTLPLGN